MGSCQEHELHLGIIDQNPAPFVQLLHDLQNGHLDIDLHTLLHVRDLADTNAHDKSSQKALPRDPNCPGTPIAPAPQLPRHPHLRAANLLGVLLQCGMFVPQALHQRGQEFTLVPHCIFQKLVPETTKK